MARPRINSPDHVLEKGMRLFWKSGYEATSMSQLVEATGSTRQTIYRDFESKHRFYARCFGLYHDRVVAPALKPFGATEQGLNAIAEYFELQIVLAERMGLPGPGCLVGNAMTEIAPNDPEIAALVKDHNHRLELAFASALPSSMTEERRQQLSEFLVLSAQGLWAMSRITSSADELRKRAATIMSLISKETEDA
ncbi:TetR/AcrR family transcriptional regulator [Altererythrobacter lutimaris]|uniref:TetR/AcrR family transcriptional regulator n=1 Tax=Altererythrobacter lutimaris TaxID=2743979 RepID=A0A850H9H8_9SPHN|nr:TetR/AcrR family transcriptional regulator [Altererythrobacter lutimaris]NVE94553.1 TetR/AcrR family transcriptional regulator [Altererythrobacter lutimaris]